MTDIAATPLHRLASLFYGTGVALRNAAFDYGLFRSSVAALPCICVGNVVVGGSGKTPFTQFLAASLLARGRRPAVLLRGYRGTYQAPLLVTLEHSPTLVGDEAALHRLVLPPEIPVAVARNRLEGIELLQRECDAEVVLLDDGLQHRWLRCDLNVLLLNATDAEAAARWQQGRLLPAGYLREPLQAVLRRCDAIIYTARTSPVSTAQQSAPPIAIDDAFVDHLPRSRFIMRPSHYVDVFSGAQLALSGLRGRECDAATAVADPRLFFKHLERLGVLIKERHSFPDHHQFSDYEVSVLLNQRRIPLLVTEKDAVKLRPSVNGPDQVLMLVTQGAFASAIDEKVFWQNFTRRPGSRLAAFNL